MTGKKPTGETQTGPTPFGHNPLSGRAHIVNRDALQDEASSGPGSLDPKTLAPPKVNEAKRWLAKRGIELNVPANWKYLGIGHDGRSMTFVSDTDSAAHAIELHLSPIPADVSAEALLTSQEEQVAEAVEFKRVLSFSRRTLGQVPGLLIVGWGPETRDAVAEVADEDLYLATDGTGRRALSWRGVAERDGERTLVMVALSSPIEQFPDARACYDAILDHLGVWA